MPYTTRRAADRPCYAHSVPGIDPEAGWETVEDHLRRVADGVVGEFPGAAGLAEAFGGGDLARVAALWHDLGKYSDAFQDYMLASTQDEAANAHIEDEAAENGDRSSRRSRGRVDHSTFGATHAASKTGLGWLISYMIAGHHGGLPDAADLGARLVKPGIGAAYAPEELLSLAVPAEPALALRAATNGDTAFRVAFLTRMIFSSLVDADFRATEWFMDQRRYADRTAHAPPPLTALRDALDKKLATFAAAREPASVDHHRAEVLRACRARAADKPGFFSLTVPTGGGKTLSSLAFALNHAITHGLRRVIYAIPFTSIIEQNADVFRDALAPCGPAAMIEHHTNFEPKAEDRWSRLASENWDAPLVLTTNVQLFESLFAAKPSRCRKLHNIAKSVIILDEAQTIPVNLLRPTLAALEELVRNYGCTVVLCTATQPALTKRDGFPIGLPEPREIVTDVAALFNAMRRTVIEPTRPLDNDALAAELAQHRQVLCIVHTKKAAATVWRSVAEQTGDGGCFHLSTHMCAEHRSERIREIRRRLEADEPCRVVSTSLIEAGVDVDFPVVYRAFAGFDAIAQAAGRCNRNGRLPHPGRVVVFETADRPRFLFEAIESARLVGRRFTNPIEPDAIQAYFEEHYWKHSDRWDAERVMACFGIESVERPPFWFNFTKAAEAYRLIDNAQQPVVVPWGERGQALVKELESLTRPADAGLRRRMQRFTVNLFATEYRKLEDAGAITAPLLAGGIAYLTAAGGYDDDLGLDPDRPTEAGSLML